MYLSIAKLASTDPCLYAPPNFAHPTLRLHDNNRWPSVEDLTLVRLIKGLKGAHAKDERWSRR